MKHFSFSYTTQESLINFINEHKITNEKNILIQVFTSKNDLQYIQSLQEIIKSILPQAKLIGSTTDGEINSEGLQENSTIFSFSLFEKTKIEINLIEGVDISSDQLGQEIIKSFDPIAVENSKIAFSFTDGLHTNGDKYLQGINKVNPNIIIAGGMAGDQSRFTKTYVFTLNEITSYGAVMAILINPNLYFCSDYSFDWEAIGPKHIVTKSKENIVYMIDDLTAVDFYKKYLGEKVVKALPAIGIEFPLITYNKGMEVARAVININDDGSLVFAGNVSEGTTVTFGFGNVNKIVYKGSQTINDILDTSIEGIYIYSCMARKHLLGNDINIELHPLSKIANVAGFFTYGEFFSRDKTNYLLNQSMTIIGLSESPSEDFYCDSRNKAVYEKNPPLDTDNVLRLEALSNLVTQTSKEYDKLNENLHKRVQEEVVKNLEKDAMIQINAKHAQLGEMMEMILHQWRQPLSVMKTIITGAQVEQQLGLLEEEKVQANRKNLLENIDHLSQTIHDFRDFFKQGDRKQILQLTQILDKVNLFTYPLCKKENIELTTNIFYNNPIEMDSSKLVQAIMNIVKNGIDALVENKTDNRKIDITIKQEDSFLTITIKDNGGGIPHEILPKVFEKRFTTKSDHGTGLGLHMTKTIVEFHLKGTIEVKNVDEGAMFTIKLPLEV